MKLDSPIRRTILIFISLSGGLILFLSLRTFGSRTLEAMARIRLGYLLLALGLLGLANLFDMLQLRILAKALGVKLTWRYAAKSMYMYYFISNITPTATGGEPLMIYMLSQKGLRVGKASVLVVVRGFLQIVLIAVTGPLVIYFHRDLVNEAGLKLVFDYALVILSILGTLLVCALVWPKKVEKISIQLIEKLVSRFGGRFRSGANVIERRIKIWVKDFIFNLKKFFTRQRRSVLQAGMLTIASWLSYNMIAFVVLKGLNYPLHLGKVFMVEIVVYFLLYFSPTPGGSGIAEGGFYLLFAPLVPQYLLGIFVILWRFFTSYLLVLVGGLITIKTMGIDQLEKIKRLG